MKSLGSKLIIYDSNCKVCTSLRDVVLKLTSLPEEKVRAYKTLDADLSGQIDPDKFRNAMALIDTSGGRTLYGAEGIAYIFSSQYKIADLLLGLRPVFKLFSFLYNLQAYNRYIIATPKNKFHCNCFPDRVVKYRISYIVLAVVISCLLTALFGLSLRGFFTGMAASEAVIQMLLIAGTGWVVQMVLAMIFMRPKALDYIGHLSSMMVAGLLILVPWMLLHAVTGIENIYLPLISVLASSACMLYLHIHRIKYLEMSQAWTITWFLSLQTTALYWIYCFHLK